VLFLFVGGFFYFFFWAWGGVDRLFFGCWGACPSSPFSRFWGAPTLFYSQTASTQYGTFSHPYLQQLTPLDALGGVGGVVRFGFVWLGGVCVPGQPGGVVGAF